MPPVGFEPTISVLERAKTVRALDCDRLGNVMKIFRVGRVRSRTEATEFVHLVVSIRGAALALSVQTAKRQQTKDRALVSVKGVVLCAVWEPGEMQWAAVWKFGSRLTRAPCRFLPATERPPPANISEPRPARPSPDLVLLDPELTAIRFALLSTHVLNSV
jgi:hypothetical protein